MSNVFANLQYLLFSLCSGVDMRLSPVLVYRLIKTLRTVRSLVPLTLALVTALALIGIIQPLGDEIEDDAFVL